MEGAEDRMVGKEIDRKVIDFAQTATSSTKFRFEYPVSMELREEMVRKVFRDFMNFAIDRYYDETIDSLEEFVTDLQIKDEKFHSLLFNLFWWRLFSESSENNGSDVIEEYIAENYHWLSEKPIFISWLKECKKAITSFYFIGYKFNDRALVAIDLFTEETIEILVYDPLAIPPKKGEIAFGTLIPIGGGSFFPIIDFYHFDFGARQEIANHLQHYYEEHLRTSPAREVIIYILTAMLQIEQLVSMENQESGSLEI
jgi:hypothetical protein